MFLSYPLKLAHKASVTPRYPQLAYNLDMKAGKQLASVLALSGRLQTYIRLYLSPSASQPVYTFGTKLHTMKMDMSHGSSPMSSTFSSSTKVTLWFTYWTTTSTASYVLSLVLLFSLGMLNRFLGALKSQLERKWSETRHTKEVEHDRSHKQQWSRALRQQPVRLEEPEDKETEPLSPTAPVHDAEKAHTRTHTRQKFWVASAPWNIKKDGTSAALEFVRALIAYMLYVHSPIDRCMDADHGQDARCDDVRCWNSLCGYGERAAGRLGVWEVCEGVDEFGRGWVSLVRWHGGVWVGSQIIFNSQDTCEYCICCCCGTSQVR